MFFIGIFFLLLLLLFLSSQILTRAFSHLLQSVVRSHKLSVRLLAFFFFPGVVIHELSHAIMAYMLLVPVGRIEFLPVTDGDHVKLGSVQIGKTDPVRRMLIGLAPLIAGTSLLAGLLYYFMPKDISFVLSHVWQVILLLYAVFVIGNTMFSSRKDVEGIPALLLAIIVFGSIGYFAGIRIPAEWFAFLESDQVREFFRTGCVFLGIPLVINAVSILFLKMVVRR